MTQTVEFVDVGPGVGLLSNAVVLPTNEKLELIEQSIAVGIHDAEVARFVNPENVKHGFACRRLAQK